MINERPELPNKHTLYIGASGSGKSNALRANREARGARVIMFDPNSDHQADNRARTREDFLSMLSAAIRSGKAYRVAYTPRANDRYIEHEFFCLVICMVLDGSKPIIVIDDELAQSCKSSGKAEPWHKKMINEGRKYGLIYHGVIQIPQRVPKDVYDNCDRVWIGRSKRLPQYAVDNTGVSRATGMALQDLEFIVCDARAGQKRIKVPYKK